MIFRAAVLALALGFAAQAGAQSQAPPDPILEAGKINARLAMEYLKRDQLQVAQEKIEKALQQNPKDVNVQLSAGLVYERLHEMKLAEKHFRLALRASPDSPEAQNALGAFFCRNKQQAKGEEMFLKAAANQLYRTPFVAYTNAGVCARSAGNLEQAERYLRQALTSQVDYPETYAQLAGVLHDRGNNLQARAFVEPLPRSCACDARHAAARAQHRGRAQGRGRRDGVQGAADEGIPGFRAGTRRRRPGEPESRMSARPGGASPGVRLRSAREALRPFDRRSRGPAAAERGARAGNGGGPARPARRPGLRARAPARTMRLSSAHRSGKSWPLATLGDVPEPTFLPALDRTPMARPRMRRAWIAGLAVRCRRCRRRGRMVDYPRLARGTRNSRPFAA